MGFMNCEKGDEIDTVFLWRAIVIKRYINFVPGQHVDSINCPGSTRTTEKSTN